jgi:hypothetical protein
MKHWEEIVVASLFRKGIVVDSRSKTIVSGKNVDMDTVVASDEGSHGYPIPPDFENEDGMEFLTAVGWS